MARDKSDDSNFFWNTKYGRDTNFNEQYVDITDAYANELKMVISFMHVPTGKTVFFKGFITGYSESFTQNWSGEPVFGRTDPIYRYGGTERIVKLSFDVPAGSEGEAYENMGRIQRLVQFQYPSYELQNEFGGEYIVGQSPLIRIKAMNLIQKGTDMQKRVITAGPGDNNIRQQLRREYVSSPLPEQGLLAAVKSLGYNIEIGNAPVFETAPNTVLPQVYKVTVDFAVIHEQTNGFDGEGNFINKYFPYQARMYVNQEKTIAADQSYRQRIQSERDLQAAQDIAKSRFRGAFGKLRRRKAIKKAARPGASEFDRALGDEGIKSLRQESPETVAEEIAKINK